MTYRAHLGAEEGPDDLVVIEHGDPLPVERSDPLPPLVGMRGHYQIEGWRDAEGNGRHFECAIVKISPQMINLSVPVTGAVGSWGVVNFEHLGKFEGPIIQIQKHALVIKIFGTNEDRAKLASKLAWFMKVEKIQARRHPRIVPASPVSIVSLPGEPALSCEVIDYSLGGAAVYADVSPQIGSVVKVGKVFSRVVRLFGGGFAVAFMAVQNPHSVEAAVLRPPQAGVAME
jgi:hypothetical protein